MSVAFPGEFRLSESGSPSTFSDVPVYFVNSRFSTKVYHLKSPCGDAKHLVATTSIGDLKLCNRCKINSSPPDPNREKKTNLVYNSALRLTALNRVVSGESIKEVSSTTGINISTLRTWVKLSRTGQTEIKAKHKREGIPKHFHSFLLSIFYSRTATIATAQEEMQLLLGKRVSNTAIKRVLNLYKFSYHIHKISNPVSFSVEHVDLRAKWAKKMLDRNCAQSKFIFIDECRFETCINRKSWRHRGAVSTFPTQGYPHTNKISVCAAMNSEGVILAHTIPGHFNSRSFADFITSLRKKIPNPNEYTLIMDNLGVHRERKLVMPALAPFNVAYLPSYTPHFNAIEYLWRHIKNNIRY